MTRAVRRLAGVAVKLVFIRKGSAMFAGITGDSDSRDVVNSE
jgi:hypothetical protein